MNSVLSGKPLKDVVTVSSVDEIITGFTIREKLAERDTAMVNCGTQHAEKTPTGHNKGFFQLALLPMKMANRIRARQLK